VPSKLWKLSGEDFFSKAQGRYDTMGVDRLACLRGALELHGAPALVFDGGTATTYTASDASGNIMGGGIGPGLAAKFNAMVDTTSDLPELSPGMIEAACNRIVLSKTPLSTFSDNTEDAMLVDVLGEFAYKSRTIIHQWLSKTKTASKTKAANKKKKDTKPDKVNNERMILVTGGDGEIYSKLLEPDHSKIVEMEPNGSPTGPRVSDAWSYKVMHTKHLIHYGIKAALLAQVELHSQREATIQQEKDNKLFMGLRVVKMFDGEPYGGTVTSIVRADDIEEELFDIHYDDDDSDQNTPSELYALLMLYYEKGEPGGVKGNADQNKKKREASKAAAEELKKRGYYSPVVAAPKKTSEKTTDSSTSTATAAVVATADTVPPKIQTKTTTPAVSPSKSVEVPKRPAAMADLATSVTSAKKSKTKKVYAFQKKANPKDYLNDRVAKVFDDRKTYFGTIKEYSSDADGNLWRIFYDDGDTEDYDEHDIKASIILYEQKKKNDPEHKYRNYAATPSSQMTPPQVPKKKDGGSKAK
jgi:pantothenate kinase type III